MAPITFPFGTSWNTPRYINVSETAVCSEKTNNVVRFVPANRKPHGFG